MNVIDASVVVDALVAFGDRGLSSQDLVAAERRLNAPAILRAEVAAALRRLVLHGEVAERDARAALVESRDLPVVEYSFAPLQVRAWQLRHGVTIYDAWYIALAEALGATLVTSDERLAGAPGILCPVEVVGT